jgi:hydrogenase maturation protein HypF
MELEAVAGELPGSADHEGDYRFGAGERDGMLEMDPAPVLCALVDDLRRGTPVAVMSTRFHDAVAAAVRDVARRVRTGTRESTVVLSGGVFQNVRLLERTADGLEADGFRVLTHRRVPPNDGGLSLGQAACAGRSSLARRLVSLGP